MTPIPICFGGLSHKITAIGLISPDKKNEWPDCLIAYFFKINTCYAYSSEASHRNISNEYSNKCFQKDI